jgi:hypothetical protein
MSIINPESGFCLSPTGSGCLGIDFNECEDPYKKSGQFITISNVCTSPVIITGFHNNNPTRFTIIDFPTFSGSGEYDSANPLTQLPKTLAPYEDWDINTWFHPTHLDLQNAGYGTRLKPTGTKLNAVISVRPGDLGFADCDNFFTLSGEFICETCEFMPTGLGSGYLSLSDFPPPPIEDECNETTNMFKIVKKYGSLASLEADQPQGAYSLLSTCLYNASGYMQNPNAVRSTLAGASANVDQIIAGGGNTDINNMFSSSRALAAPWEFLDDETLADRRDPPVGMFKISNSPFVPTGSGIGMEVGQGITGVGYDVAMYEGPGGSETWNNMMSSSFLYFATGVSGANYLELNLFASASGISGLEKICQGQDPYGGRPVIDYGEQAIRFYRMEFGYSMGKGDGQLWLYGGGPQLGDMKLTTNNSSNPAPIIGRMGWFDSNDDIVGVRSHIKMINDPNAINPNGCSKVGTAMHYLAWDTDDSDPPANRNMQTMNWNDNGNGLPFFEGGFSAPYKFQIVNDVGAVIRDKDNVAGAAFWDVPLWGDRPKIIANDADALGTFKMACRSTGDGSDAPFYPATVTTPTFYIEVAP